MPFAPQKAPSPSHEFLPCCSEELQQFECKTQTFCSVDAARQEKSVQRSVSEQDLSFSWHKGARCLVSPIHLPFRLEDLKPVAFQVSSKELFFLEIFAGSAHLSAEARNAGLQPLPIDKSKQRQVGAAVTVLDLTAVEHQAVMLDIVCNANIAAAHFGCPFAGGEYSGSSRSPQQIMQTHSLYAFVLVLISLLHFRGVVLGLENPNDSQFWDVMHELVAYCTSP